MMFPRTIADLIPPAEKQPHKEFSEERVCNSAAQAENLFAKAKEHLQQPHLWKELTGFFGADFEPYTAGGASFEGPVKEGNFLKIKVGGPLPLGSDWVLISHLITQEEKDTEAMALQVHPCAPPAGQTESEAEDTTEHFFDKCATST